ncbi:MAG: iron complex outermembrane recepter protein [Bacteroidetes bacterium]|nr:MAG: iron complex outermembrane recepter protein [Bacteroidota bacterium]
MIRPQLLFSLAVFLLISRLTAAQEIVVRDAYTGEKLQGALVSLQSAATAETRRQFSDADGKVVFTAAGKQVLSVRFTGYHTYRDTLENGMEKFTARLLPAIDSMPVVVVTAQYGAADPDEAVQQVKIISREKIDARGAQNLRELLNSETNIRIAQDQVLGSSMSLQGLSGENVKILIDGVPVIGRLNGNIDLSQINLGNVERIEIVEGPLSVNYGTNALAGAVNLISKRTQASPFSIQSDNYYESSGNYNFTGRTGGRLKRSMVSLSGGRNFFDGWSAAHDPFYVDWQPIADSTRFDEWKPREQKFATFYFCRYFDRASLGLTADVFREQIVNRGLPRAPYGESAFDDYYRTARRSLVLNYKHRLSSKYNFSTTASAGFFGRIKNRYFRDLTTLQDQLVSDAGQQDTSVFSLFMFRPVITRSADSLRFRFEAGLDMNYETASGLRIEGREKQIGDYAAYASAEYKVYKKLALRPGLRYSWNSVFKTSPVPSLSLRYEATDRWTLRASYARGFRAPALKELYFYFVDINHNILGNTALLPEESDNAQVSFTYKKAGKSNAWRLNFSGFYNDMHNMITLALVTGTEYSYINIGRYKTTGGGMNVALQRKQVQVSAGALYAGRYNELSAENDVPVFSWSPELNGSFDWKIAKTELMLAGFYKYTGRLPGYTINAAGETELLRMNDYHTADLTLSRRWWEKRLMTEIGLRNLFDVKNVASSISSGNAHNASGSSAPIATGRQYFFRVLWDLSFEKKKS